MVSPVGLGLWPISGVSSLNVNKQDSLATIHAALDTGCNHIDTAFSYGYEGEADWVLSQVLASRRDEIVVASKVGQYFDQNRQRIVDGRPETLLKHAETILHRLGIETLDIMYLHLPDPQVPLRESAEGVAEIIQRGWAKYAGVSNVDAKQLKEFHEACPVIVVQPPFNMLQQASVNELRDYCSQQNIGVACYWVLMKGLLAGKLARDHRFDPRDKRLTYPMYQGQQWHRVQDFLDLLRGLAEQSKCTVAQLVVHWTMRQPNIQVALCGAKRSEQIQETVEAMRIELAPDVLARIDKWIQDFGEL
jgi:aryl-alcohol dehydrogenase-like predicted oxidoreductase